MTGITQREIPPYLKPSFFIVGAPKCGTTALYTYLKAHPEVFMPEKVKEPNFFSTDLDAKYFVKDSEPYHALFANAGNTKAIGEASTRYLYSKCAASNIHAYCPEAKIIIMLRSPIDMIYALYAQHRRNCHENYASFKEALDAEERRLNGKEPVPDSYCVDFYLYRKAGLYAAQVKRYQDIFPPEQIKLIFFEDFSQNTAVIYREVLEFLEVDPAFTTDFRKVNTNRRYRFYWIHQSLYNRSWPLRTMVRKIVPQSLRYFAYKLLSKLNTQKKSRPSMDPALRNSLCDYFRDDVAKLSQLTGRDLSHWVHKTNLTQHALSQI